MTPEKSLNCPGPYERLLACTDGSDEGQSAVSQALALSRACGSKLCVVQVVEIVPEFEAVAPDLRACLEEEVHRQRALTASQAALQGVELDYRIIHCLSPFSAILAEAEKLQPQLIIMGRHGRTALARLFMGSVTQRVIGLSPVNVLVAPRDAALAFQRLLIASDGSPHSAAALEEALAMARRTDAELHGVVVAPEEGDIPEAQEILHGMLTAANRQAVSFQGHSPQGLDPDDGIIQVALDQRVDLIIMGSHGRTGIKKLLLGSVTERVIGQTPCPVLVVKKK
jgi:hypothetical protein